MLFISNNTLSVLLRKFLKLATGGSAQNCHFLPALCAKCPHWLTSPPLSVRTQHKFRKMLFFCTKKCGRPLWRSLTLLNAERQARRGGQLVVVVIQPDLFRGMGALWNSTETQQVGSSID